MTILSGAIPNKVVERTGLFYTDDSFMKGDFSFVRLQVESHSSVVILSEKVFDKISHLKDGIFDFEFQNILGLDRGDFSSTESYERVQESILNDAPGLLVICNQIPSESDYKLAESAYRAGYSVYIIRHRDLAPEATSWRKR